MAKSRFNSVKQVQPLIDKYFKECWQPKMDKVIKKESLNKKSRELRPEDYEFIPILDKNGKEELEQVIPYTTTGLALALGLCSRTELWRYEMMKHKTLDIKVKQDIANAIKRAKMIILNALEELIMTSHTPAGAIFMGKARHKMIEEEKRLGLKINIKQDIRYSIEQVPKLANPVLINGEVRDAIDKP